MRSEDFPALYRSADEASLDAQAWYLWLIRGQYALLIGAACIALGFGTSPNLYIAYAAVIAASTALLMYLSVKKPENDWYACRALAESVKTSTWRYMMRAKPFADRPSVTEVREEFAAFLRAILDANSYVRDSISRRPIMGDQITAAMDAKRALTLDMRKELYRRERIDDQRSWYVGKVRTNRRQFAIWAAACGAVQAAAILLVLLRIRYDEQWQFWPTEPLIVLASSVIGWTQIKKFNELSSAYSLAAHEIGIIETQIGHATSEEAFSEFVNDAERAFSREHTQWVARQVGPV